MTTLILVGGNSSWSLCRSEVFILAAMLAGLFASREARAATANLTPLKDNTLVQSTNPTVQASGGQGDLFVGRTGQDGQNPPITSIRRGLIEFDVGGGVPDGATITSVILTVRDVQALNADQPVSLHRLTQDWGEGASSATGPAANGDATWLFTFFNAANPGASPTWTTPGGTYAASASATVIVSDDNGPLQSFSWSSATHPQLLADVQQWRATPAANFGWIMIGNESAGNTAKRFNSGESPGPPVLQITYIPEPTCPTTTAAAFFGMFVSLRSKRRWVVSVPATPHRGAANSLLTQLSREAPCA
jgi:hypothetical protein